MFPKNADGVLDDRDNINSNDDVILIIEDDPQFTRILRKKVHEKKCKCLIAPDGISGLLLAEKFSPKAIILDVQLPDINGFDVNERLKRSPATANIPIFFMSIVARSLSFTDDSTILGYLTKPISIDDLEEAFLKIKETINEEINQILVVEDEQVIRDILVDKISDRNIKSKKVFLMLTMRWIF